MGSPINAFGDGSHTSMSFRHDLSRNPLWVKLKATRFLPVNIHSNIRMHKSKSNLLLSDYILA